MDKAGDDIRKSKKKRLFCAVVGYGQPFPVDVGMGDTMVSDLKDVIKARVGITVPQMEMRLFLAKKGQGGDWLSTADAAAVAFDEHGKPPQDFKEMDPTLYLENAKNFEQGFKPREGQVHVLVVLPIDRATKRQKVESRPLVGRWKTVAVEMAELSRDLQLDHLEAGHMLAVPRTVFGTEFRNGLYIRQEHWEVYDSIQNALASSNVFRRVLVLGSPGVGKSVFGVFLLLMFMTKKKDVAFRALGEQVVYYFTWSDANGYEISNSPRDGNSYEGLFDGSELDCEFGAPYYRHVYLFASPRPRNYNDFVKEGCFRVTMNPWTKEECRSFVDVMHAKGKDQESEAEYQSSVAMEDEEKESKEESLSSVVGDDRDEWFQKFNIVGGSQGSSFQRIHVTTCWTL